MRYHSHTLVFATIRLLLGMLVIVVADSANGHMPGIFPVSIFGDGNPDNGIEDNREQLMGMHGGDIRLADQRLNAGTIKCDGKIRGTAMVIDAREYAPNLKGVILATAAHVLFDLEKKRRFRRCEFHFLALGEISSYRAKIDLKNVRKGDFDPKSATGSLEFGEGDWAFLYVPRPWKNFSPEETLSLRDFSFSTTETYQQAGGEFRLIAFDSSTGVISQSRDCTVIESRGDDLGGGSWKGQLLDDCDSTGGASGGGIVAVVNQQQFLIGIRNGTHWSDQVFPASDYPLGPPAGAIWDRRTNTNFGRAIDAHLLRELGEFIQQLRDKGCLF